MFTGLIEEVGTLLDITTNEKSFSLKIGASSILSDIKLGDSIATNGVCLTVTDYSYDYFIVDVMPQTLKLSNLGVLKSGTLLNLEPALKINSRLGGHIVSGHIDTTGVIEDIKEKGNSLLYTIAINNSDNNLVLPRGSIAIDGISLTIAEVNKNNVTVSTIPHTRSNTNLKVKSIGDIVNIEYDIFGKYIKNFFINKESVKEDSESIIDIDFLTKNNFI